MLRLRFNFLIILIVMFTYAIEELTLLKDEVVDTAKFTEYYSAEDAEDQGEQILDSNYFVMKREYSFTETGAIVVVVPLSEEESQEVASKEVVIKDEKLIPATLIEYQVQKGDTIGYIAKKYNVDEEIIKINNPKNIRVLKIGEKLRIPSENGVFHKVQKGDSLFKIAQKYKVKIGDVRRYNALETDALKLGQEIFIKNPDLKSLKTQIARETGVKSDKPKGATTSGFIMPIRYSGVSSPYGNRFHPVLKRYIMHAGVDLRARYIPFKAAQSGTVTFAGYKSGYGKILIIKHSDNYETRYAHTQSINVKKGEKVTQGQVVGQTGNTGRSTGPHLHFEIRKNGKTLDPMRNVAR